MSTVVMVTAVLSGVFSLNRSSRRHITLTAMLDYLIVQRFKFIGHNSVGLDVASANLTDVLSKSSPSKDVIYGKT